MMTYVFPVTSSLLRSDSGLGNEIKVHCSCVEYPACIITTGDQKLLLTDDEAGK